MKRELADVIGVEGVVALAQHRDLRSAIKSALRRREIISVLRGVYALPRAADTFLVRCRAVLLADPDAVLHGATALAVHGWGPEPRVLEVVTHRLHPRGWLRVSRRGLDPERIREAPGLRVTDRATTALDNAVPTGGESLDNALRVGLHLSALTRALGERKGHRGVRAERGFVRDSRDSPWSPAERKAHVLLRGGSITGWVANFRTPCGDSFAYIDLAFRKERVAIEIDGDRWHTSPEDVLRDRERDRLLSEQGWTVVHLRARYVDQQPQGFLGTVRAVLAANADRRGPRRRHRNQRMRP